jgi:hypothetical protein
MEEAIAPSEGKVTRSNLVGAAIKTQSRSRVCRFCAFPTQRLDAYAADFRLRVGGGAISASAGMPHWRCSFQAMLIVRACFRVRMSDARCREPSRRPRSAWV